jgi:DNA mismatch repair protein MutS
VLEYTADKKRLGAKTMFATHYHELTELENKIEGVKNYNIAVKKRGDDITFLRRIVPGCADGSYGIEVAKLAGVPAAVVERAKVVLEEIEKESGRPIVFGTKPGEADENQISFASSNDDIIRNRLRNIDINTLTPIEAMQTLYELASLAE